MDAFPEVAAEWYYKKNCGYGPEDFNYGSNVKVWWQCQNNKKHIWTASIANRTTNQAGCMICNVGKSTDLRDYPEALAQFDYKKNKGVDPHKLGWHTKVRWKCTAAADHVWVSTFNRRHGERCPFCKGSKLSKTNRLVNMPEVAKMLHPTKNGNKTAKDFRISEQTLVWWKCDRGPDHEWQAKIYTKTTGSLGCPFCSANKVSITNCLATRHPQVAKEWHPTKNKPKTPKDVIAGSLRKYWWKCKLGHVWLQSLVLRTSRGCGCPKCGKQKRKEQALKTKKRR